VSMSDVDPPTNGEEVVDPGDGTAEDPEGSPPEDNTTPPDAAESPDTPIGEMDVDTSSGCSGAASPPDGPQTMDVDGTQRSYIVVLPEGYDPETPYPLIFAFHGLGGSAELV